jgi:hypothetical protein
MKPTAACTVIRTPMKDPKIIQDLKSFAGKQIAADRYPNDHHSFNFARCGNCGIVPLTLTIEHHSGTQKTNFKGVIWAQCECGRRERIFSFTGEHRKPERREVPVCRCGNKWFVVCECERFEGSEGLSGFFDEGVVVGKCSECGRNRVMVYTD